MRNRILFFLHFFKKKFGLHPAACGISIPQPRIKSTFPALEGGVLTTGPPGRSLKIFLLFDTFGVCLDSCLINAPGWKDTLRVDEFFF